MNTSITLSLDTRRAKKDGTFPIIFRLTHQRKTTSITTGYSVPKSAWDDSKDQVRRHYKGIDSVPRLNNSLAKRKAEMLDDITKLADSGSLVTYTITDLKSYLVGRLSDTTVFGFAQECITQYQKAKKYGTAHTMKGALGSLKKFRQDRDLTFEQMTFPLLEDYEKWCFGQGHGVNGIAARTVCFRLWFNRAINAGLVDKERYPFTTYKIKREKTRKRALTSAQLKAIIELHLPADTELWHTRNLFLASYWLMGINHRDMAHLRVRHLQDGRFVYRRRKTNKLYDIKVCDALAEILTYYCAGKEPSDFLFPILTSEDPEEQHAEANKHLQEHNRHLKALGQKVGIEQSLTTYVARHTFASEANRRGIPVTAISNMMGHSSLNMTQIYLASFEQEVIDDYAEQVFG